MAPSGYPVAAAPVPDVMMAMPVGEYRTTVSPVAVQAVAPVRAVVSPRWEESRVRVPRGKLILRNGRAIAPPDAPEVVRRAVAAGNRLQKYPYKWGGGHARLDDDGYDCSGEGRYVLRESGLMKDQMVSRGF
ncbi:MAG: hypothetical protein AAGC74_05250, partial [Verrucomicrobiota bacterium]